MLTTLMKMAWHGTNYREATRPRLASPPPIYGDADFVAKNTEAWNLMETTPGADRVMGAVKEIRQGDINDRADAYGGGGVTTICNGQKRSASELAAIHRHEAAHSFYQHATSTPENEREAMIEENQTRSALGIPERDPNDFSFWVGAGFLTQEAVDNASAYGVTHTSRDGSDPYAWIREHQNQAESKPNWPESWANAPGRLGLNRMRAI